MMRKLLVLCGIMLMLTGCGGKEQAGSMEGQKDVLASDVTLPATEQSAAKDKDNTEDFAPTEGALRETPEGQNALENETAVNVTEASEEIQQEANTMLNNLELPGYRNEAVNMIISSLWLDTMLEGERAGEKSYYLKRDDKIVLEIKVGYGENGGGYSTVRYLQEAGAVTVLTYQDNQVSMLETTLWNGQYEGDYVYWLADGNSGNILREWGRLKQGKPVEDSDRQTRTGNGSTDLYALWCNRESMIYEEDEEEQPVASPTPTMPEQSPVIPGSTPQTREESNSKNQDTEIKYSPVLD